MAPFLIEPMYFDETKDEMAARKTKREEKPKQKGKEKVKAVEVEKVRLGNAVLMR
jgi:hypothetical protein